ncbi:MAG: hypothetical protein E7256_10235 [Lachnospiraceae bacterium]|nr:hypothetical protein [Lachnospiraceae bacterium]
MDLKKIKKKHMLIACGIVTVLAIALLVFFKKESGEGGDDAALRNVHSSEDGVKVVASYEASTITKEKTLNGHTLVAENDGYEMYLYEPSLSLIIRDKKTGSIMESTVAELDGTSNESWSAFMQSGIMVEVQENVNSQQKKLDLVKSGAKLTVNKIKDGFYAVIEYESYEIKLEVEVLLLEDGSFTVSIPQEKIVEANEKYRIGNIYIYPFLGHTRLGEREGYMFIPDGNGALIYLDDKEGRFSAGYSQKVYGNDVGVEESYVLSLFWDEYMTVNDAEKILAPVYGMVHTDSKMGYLAIIESGAECATIEAYPNGAYTPYNWITSKFRLCTLYVQPTSNSGGSVTKVTDRVPYDIKVKFAFVKEEKANYAGLATRYREYLIENDKLKKCEADYRIRLDFLGSERENWLLFKKAVSMTTASQIEEIYQELKDEGVTDILSIYKGWQSGGMEDLPIKKYNVDGCLGSEAKVKDLMDQAQNDGILFYLYDDLLRANPSTGNTTFNTIKKLDRRLYSESTYKDVYETMVFETPAKSAALASELKESLKKNGISSLAAAGISNTLFTYTYSGEEYTRLDTASVYEEILKQLNDGLDLVLEEPLSLYWQYTDAFLDMPVGNSDYIFTDQSVPFLSMVLKGSMPMYADYTNFEANKQEFFLQLIETGIYPSFYLTYEDPAALLYTNSSDIYTSKYSNYKEEIITYYNQLKQINEQTKDAYIIGHEVMGNGVTKVTYTNGVIIYINYSKNAVTADGYTIEGMSYEIGGEAVE